MQASLLNVFVRLSQKALGKSRDCDSSSSSPCESENYPLSDAAFAALLQEIDFFSGEFMQKGSEDVVPEAPIYQLKIE